MSPGHRSSAISIWKSPLDGSTGYLVFVEFVYKALEYLLNLHYHAVM